MINRKKIVHTLFSDKKTLFCFLVLLTLVFTIIRTIMVRGESNRWFLFYDENDTFMDFYNSVYDAHFSNPYREKGVIYPPLAYVIYRFFGHMIPVSAITQGSKFLRTYQSAILSFCLYLVVTISLFVFSLYMLLGKWKKGKTILPFVILVSSPVCYAFERGNMIMIAVSALLLFLAWYDDEKTWKKEIALISLAVAANIKIYPAVFGLLLLKHDKWKEALRCAVYALLLFLLLMPLFGGYSNIPVFIGNIFSTSDGFETIYRTRVDIGNIFRYLSEHNMFTPISGLVADYIFPLGTMILCLTGLSVRDEWKKILCCSLICSALPGFSWMYNLMYFIPAIISCMYQPEHSQKNNVYFILLLLMFLYYPFNIMKFLPFPIDNSAYTYRIWDLICTACNFLLFLMVLFDGLIEHSFNRYGQIVFLTDSPNSPCKEEPGKIRFFVDRSEN